MSDNRPNILFIMADDHAAQAISCYGSDINATPNIDKIAEEGVRFENTFCTNSICTPSRASILTGQYSHENDVYTLENDLDPSHPNVAKELQKSGYETAAIGKWHLHTQPKGFDYYSLLPGQGSYNDPKFKDKNNSWSYRNNGGKQEKGYVTDLITEKSIQWIDSLTTKDRPFFLMCNHKAPHRPWIPDEAHKDMYKNETIPVPETFEDDYTGRAQAAKDAQMRIGRDLTENDLKRKPSPALTNKGYKYWSYQRFIKDYLRTVASIDDNVGKLLDFLTTSGLLENTLVIYTSDQGFFLGEHGWFDKRFMYEESLRMPLLARYPKRIEPDQVVDEIVLNIDLPAFFLDYADKKIPEWIQGRSFRPFVEGKSISNWRNAMYYRYWMHLDHYHNVYSHYGLRTDRYKIINYYGEALSKEGNIEIPKEIEWELFDLKNDPDEMKNLYNNHEYRTVQERLMRRLYEKKQRLGDTD